METPARFAADPAWGARAAWPLRLVAGRGARPTGEEVAALKAALWQRDEAAAAVVREVSVRELHQGHVPEAFLAAARKRPDWVDDELVVRGASACRRFGIDAGLVLTYGSLLGGYRTAAALEPLVRTGRLSGDGTRQRVVETSRWWRAVTAPGGLAPDGEGWRLTLHVRLMHALVNARLGADPTWDWAGRGEPINQYDLGSTLGIFSTSFLLHLRLLGIRVSRTESVAVMHLWSYVGWLMGVDERWLPHDEKRGRRLLYHFLAHDPPPDSNSVALARALIDATDGVSRHDRWEREKSLSVGSWLLGPRAMHDLGLPYRVPWYGLARVAANLVMRPSFERGERQASKLFARWGATLDPAGAGGRP